jgi:hypothetical protein
LATAKETAQLTNTSQPKDKTVLNAPTGPTLFKLKKYALHALGIALRADQTRVQLYVHLVNLART